MYYVYILQSKINKQIYLGSTNDLKKRFKDHNNGKVTSTKRYIPWILIYYEAYNTERLTRLREKALKHHGNAMKELKKRIGLKKEGKVLPSTTFSTIKKSGAGFTLIELLIYTSILVVVLAFTGEFLYSIGQARLANSARIEVAQNAQMVVNKLRYDLSRATSISIPADSTPTTNLVFTLPGDFETSYFLEEGGIIQRTFDLEENNLTNNQVSASLVNFQKVSNVSGKETIQVKFTLRSNAKFLGGVNVSEEFQTTVSRR